MISISRSSIPFSRTIAVRTSPTNAFHTMPNIEKMITQKISSDSHYRTTRAKTPETLVITGSTGQLGKQIIETGLTSGKRIVAISRNSSSFSYLKNNPNFTSIPLSLKEQQSQKTWNKIFDSLANEHPNLKVINALGVPHAGDLTGINFLPLDAIASSLEDIQSSFNAVSLVDINSLATSIAEAYQQKTGQLTNDPYTLSRLQGRYRIRDSKLENTLCLNVSYCTPDSHKISDGLYDMKHAWSPADFANFPIQMIIGSGEQLIQPVYISSIVDAILAHKSGKLEVDGVGIDTMTVKEFFTFYTEMVGRTPNFHHLSHEDAMHILDLGELGHAAKYSAACSKILDEYRDLSFDPQPMIDLLGYKPNSLHKLKEMSGQIEFPPPPLIKHTTMVLRNALKSTSHTKKLIRLTSTKAPHLLYQILFGQKQQTKLNLT